LEDPGVVGRIIMKWNERERNWGQGMDFGGTGVGPAVGSCECVDEN